MTGPRSARSGRVFWTLVMLGMAALVVAFPLGAHWRARGDLVVFTDPSDAGETLVEPRLGRPEELVRDQG